MRLGACTRSTDLWMGIEESKTAAEGSKGGEIPAAFGENSVAEPRSHRPPVFFQATGFPKRRKEKICRVIDRKRTLNRFSFFLGKEEESICHEETKERRRLGHSGRGQGSRATVTRARGPRSEIRGPRSGVARAQGIEVARAGIDGIGGRVLWDDGKTSVTAACGGAFGRGAAGPLGRCSGVA